jgi:electron transfer flavoprotein alpha/beta subunit
MTDTGPIDSVVMVGRCPTRTTSRAKHDQGQDHEPRRPAAIFNPDDLNALELACSP